MSDALDAKHSPNHSIAPKLLSLVAYVLFFNIFLFHSFGPVAISLQSLGFFLFLLLIYLDRVKNKSFHQSLILVACILLLNCFVLVGRANPFIGFVFHVYTKVVLIGSIYLLSSHVPFFRSLMELVMAPLLVTFSYIVSIFTVLKKFLSSSHHTANLQAPTLQNQRSKVAWIRPLVVGLIAGVPIVMVLLMILTNADPIYRSFIKKVFNLDFLKNFPQRIIISAIIFVFLTPFLYLKRPDRFSSPLRFLETSGFIHEMTVVMSLVAATMISFLSIQWQYVFASVPFETKLSQFGVATYSEYVRRGFIELLVVAGIIYGLIWFGRLVLRGRRVGQRSLLPIVQMVVIGLLLVFIVSVFRRIWLYQAYHGWSLVRIYGGFFLVWLIGITTTLFLRHFTSLRFVIWEVLFSIGLIVSLGLFNAEDFIVKTHPPTVNKRVDYVYLSHMSPDGYEGWKKAFDHAKTVLLERNYAQKSVLDKEDRREIAYAGIILHQLGQNYHALIHHYGSIEDIREYYKLLVNTAIARNQEVIRLMESYQKAYEPHPVAYDPRTHLTIDPFLKPPISKDEINGLVDEAKKKQKALAEWKKKIDNSSGDSHDWLPPLQIAYAPWQIPFDPRSYLTQSLIEFNGYPMPGDYFEQIRKDRLKELDRINRLYDYNLASDQGYARMNAEISPQMLIDLYRDFLALDQKISNQPENKHTYDTDISFATPFLD